MMELKAECERLDITFRQARHWATKGWITVTSPGSGPAPVELNYTEVRVLRVMVDLTKAGIDHEVAARTAREMVEHRRSTAYLTEDVMVTISGIP